MINPNAGTVQSTCRRCGDPVKMIVIPLCDHCMRLFNKTVDVSPEKDENGRVSWDFLGRFMRKEV